MEERGAAWEWQAEAYHRLAQPQVAWSAEVVGRLRLRGDETALDAGCGTGNLTARLVELLPDGHVIGVDRSAAMIREARRLLPERVELHVQDLTELELKRQVDVVVSNATFHWIADHARLFGRLAAVLRPGGVLEAQCGGGPNLAAAVAAIDRVGARPRWAGALTGLRSPWTFASPEETAERLRRAGFADARCWLEPREVVPSDPHAFLGTVVLGAHLALLTPDDRDDFVAEVRDELVALDRGRGGSGEVRLDYVRLNISARRDGS